MKKSNLFISTVATTAILISGAANAQSMRRETLPPPGAEVSLENFDSYMSELEGEIQSRLGQLSPDGSEEKDENGLDRPGTEAYASDLEILSKVQRDTQVLEAMLRKATLAKQVWAEIHSNPTEEYENRIRDLQGQLNETRNEMQQVTMSFQVELDDMRQQRDDALEQYNRSQSRVRSLELEAQNGQGGAGNGMQQQRPMVASIVTNGPRSYAVFSLPDGRKVEAGPGDRVLYDYEVVSIERNSVEVHRNGSKVYLEKGSYSASPDRRPSNNQQSTVIIDDVANYANN